ncbi:MAG: hypothetical protein QOD38_1928 [Acidimicrobiaceae bacterium]|jgi:nitroimidazol reductase NimA-like FMN-containing flavoprotein (pyridoxamine 5'-phosphate oxidase superfamily)
MEVDRNGLEVLGREECLRLLALATLGRVGFTSGALPAVLPVNFRLAGERILLRTSRGSTLDVALQNAVVAFEVDDFDPIDHSGWSVAVTGVAAEIDDAAGDATYSGERPQERLGLWALEGDATVVAISTEFVSGRRIAAGSGSLRP